MDNYLFAEQATIHDVVEQQKRNAQQALDELPAPSVRARLLDDLATEFVARFRLDVPILDRAAIAQLPNEEVEIDVSGDPMRAFLDRSQPF
jgi:hypothetical protein